MPIWYFYLKRTSLRSYWTIHISYRKPPSNPVSRRKGTLMALTDNYVSFHNDNYIAIAISFSFTLFPFIIVDPNHRFILFQPYMQITIVPRNTIIRFLKHLWIDHKNRLYKCQLQHRVQEIPFPIFDRTLLSRKKIQHFSISFTDK